MGDPIVAGNEAVGTRKIVFFGNCQALALQRFCQRFLAPRTGDVTTVIDIAAYDVAKARIELGNADLVVEQVFDHPLEVDAASEIGADKVVRFPNVYAIFYWPYTNQRHPRNDEIGKGYDEGPYPNELGDSFLNRLILEHVPADKALEIYLREDVSARADRLLELNAEMQRKRDDAAGMDVQSHIARHFRDDHLFRTSAHPNMRVFSLVAKGVFRRLGYTKGMVETALVAQRMSPFPRVALPIHPGVIRHLGLRFASTETRYPYFDEGDYTFAEICPPLHEFRVECRLARCAPARRPRAKTSVGADSEGCPTLTALRCRGPCQLRPVDPGAGLSRRSDGGAVGGDAGTG
jgi:hypothetical protein